MNAAIRAWAATSVAPLASTGRIRGWARDRWVAATGGAFVPERPLRRNAGQTAATQAYRLLHAGMAQAVADELIAANPCAIKRAGQRDAHDRTDRLTVSLEEMWAPADGMPERYRASVILAVCGGLRAGELFARPGGAAIRTIRRALVTLSASWRGGDLEIVISTGVVCFDAGVHRSIYLLPTALAVLLVAGCSQDAGTVPEQNIAVCFSPEAEHSPSGRVAVEFRQDGEVVAAASAAVGMAVGARVPTGAIDVYVNGELFGSVVTPDPGTLDQDGQIQGSSYLSGPGCPAEPPLG